MTDQTIGFIGLGRMGAGMATNLLANGHTISVFDLDEANVQRLCALGARGAASPSALANECELIFLCLPYSPEVEVALFGEDGVLNKGRRTTRIVDTTTLSFASAVEFAQRCDALGVRYSDCPISGMPMRANDGTLTMMFGGEKADFDAVHPYLTAMGRDIYHCGAIGMGQVMKAINNVIYDINIAGICEMLPLAIKAGLDIETVASVVTSGSSRSFASEYFVPRILEGRFDTDFAMQAAYKDISSVQEIAHELRAATPVMNAMVSTYQQTIAMGHGDEPKSAMIKLYEGILGQPVRRNES